MLRYGELAGLLLKQSNMSKGQAQRFNRDLPDLRTQIYYLEQYFTKFEHLGENNFRDTETGVTRDDEEEEDEDDALSGQPSGHYGPLKRYAIKQKLDEIQYPWRSGKVQLRSLRDDF